MLRNANIGEHLGHSMHYAISKSSCYLLFVLITDLQVFDFLFFLFSSSQCVIFSYFFFLIFNKFVITSKIKVQMARYSREMVARANNIKNKNNFFLYEGRLEI